MSFASNKTAQWIANAGLILVLTAVAIPLFSHQMFLTTRWIFTAGAALTLAGRVIDRFFCSHPADEPLRAKRLRRIELWAALMFVAGAVMMYLRNVGPTDWVAFTLAGGALTCYTSIMISRSSK